MALLHLCPIQKTILYFPVDHVRRPAIFKSPA
jgi:hypothetical protein